MTKDRREATGGPRVAPGRVGVYIVGDPGSLSIPDQNPNLQQQNPPSLAGDDEETAPPSHNMTIATARPRMNRTNILKSYVPGRLG